MIRSWIERASAIFALAGGVVLSAVALLTTVSIVGRWLADQPVRGDVELAQLGVAIAVSLSLPYCQLHGGHLIVDIFTVRAGAFARRTLDALARGAAALVFALLAWRAGAGVADLARSGETTMVLGIPLALGYAAMVPALALAAIAAIFAPPVDTQ